MNSEELNKLIETIHSSSLKYFEMTKDDFSIKMSKREVETEYKSTVETSNQAVFQNPPLVQEPAMSPSEAKSYEPSAMENESDKYHTIKSPIVGTSYLSSSPEAAPFVKVGDKVTVGQTILIIEAMKVMNEIKSDADGIVKEIDVEDGQAVEFDQALIKIDTE